MFNPNEKLEKIILAALGLAILFVLIALIRKSATFNSLAVIALIASLAAEGLLQLNARQQLPAISQFVRAAVLFLALILFLAYF